VAAVGGDGGRCASRDQGPRGVDPSGVSAPGHLGVTLGRGARAVVGVSDAAPGFARHGHLARTFVANPQPTIGSAKALRARCDVVHVFNIHVDMVLIFI
jgi:hypothetical protein